MISRTESLSEEVLSLRSSLWFALILCFSIAMPNHGFTQEKKYENLDISINATSYFYAYNKGLNDAGYALGPTVTLNNKGKLSLQFGLLYDFKTYMYSERRTRNFYTASYEQVNLFVPLSLQYNYYRSDKITLDISGGIMFGGINTINENHIAEETSIYHLTLGAGLSYRPFNWLGFRTYPIVRYNEGRLFPGVSLDVAFLLNGKVRME